MYIMSVIEDWYDFLIIPVKHSIIMHFQLTAIFQQSVILMLRQYHFLLSHMAHA